MMRQLVAYGVDEAGCSPRLPCLQPPLLPRRLDVARSLRASNDAWADELFRRPGSAGSDGQLHPTRLLMHRPLQEKCLALYSDIPRSSRTTC